MQKFLLMINFAGNIFKFLPEGALFWINKKTLIIADLHLEKGSSYFKEGQFISPKDTSENLRKLENCVDKIKPKIIIFLGDTFHDKYSLKRISNKNLEKFKNLFSHFKCYLISGNHDEDIIDSDLDFLVDLKIDGIKFVHKKSNLDKFEISGHFHPIAVVKYKGIKIKNKCFVCTKKKIILPSFGTYTGGLNVKNKNFDLSKMEEKTILMIVNEEIIRFKFSEII